MAGVPDCGICCNTFGERDRKPRVLQCGHTYCQPCLQGVVSQGSPACPSCRRVIVSPVAELPVNFIAIPASGSGGAASKNVAGKDLLCSSHQNELDFWCRECKVLLCKLCLVKTHNGHKFTVVEEVFADTEILTERRSQIARDIQDTNLSIETLQKLKALDNKIRTLKITDLEKFLTKIRNEFTDNFNILEKLSPESPFLQKCTVVECLKNDAYELNRTDISEALKQVDYWIANFPAGNYKLGDYMPNRKRWEITTGEAADRALRTMKETDHTTPKAIVRSTDESPILCLFELLQYLSTSCDSIQLELMDKVKRKYPEENDWFPLKTGGAKSTDKWHCYWLKTIASTLVPFNVWATLEASVGRSVGDSSKNKAVAFVRPNAFSHDFCVLAFGKVTKNTNGSWPLPLEVHLLFNEQERIPWLKHFLPTLYSLAPSTSSECRVYVPGKSVWGDPGYLFPLLAELGSKYWNLHRLYLDRHFQTKYDGSCRQLSTQHQVPYEWKNF